MKRLLFVLAVIVVLGFACDPQRADWGFVAINSMKTPDDPPLVCGTAVPKDTLASARASCTFTAGAHASATLGIDAQTAAKFPIRHVIIMMKENRSFDHLLGKLHDTLPEVEAIPANYTNPDPSGNAVSFKHADTTCLQIDANHQSASVVACIDGGKMDGFVKNAAATTDTDPSLVMTYYDASDLPFDYWLASTFAISDRHFAPTASGTFANRDFMMFGTNAGVVDTGLLFPLPTTPSIFQTLIDAGFTWRAYTDDPLGPLSESLDWKTTDPGVHTITDLLTDLKNGTLPNVAFVDGNENCEDDHPRADLQAGEVWSKQIVDGALASPEWQRLAIVWTYDEAGSFADHVPPPNGCLALPSTSPFTLMGPRVPLAVISPWSKRGYVSHVVHDHTAITRFVETLFDLPALTARDANSDALLDMFDFSCGRDLTPPTSPAAGTGGCTPNYKCGAD
jgi:phospholipase C